MDIGTVGKVSQKENGKHIEAYCGLILFSAKGLWRSNCDKSVEVVCPRIFVCSACCKKVFSHGVLQKCSQSCENKLRWKFILEFKPTKALHVKKPLKIMYSISCPSHS